MGVGESKHPSYEAVVSLFSQAEHEEIRRIYSEICKGNVRRGFQSQDLKAFVGHKLNEEMNNHLFCHMLLCMEGVSNPTLVRREAFTVAMAHLLKATPSERSVVFCQLASGSPSGATESQLRTVLLNVMASYESLLAPSEHYRSWESWKSASVDLNLFTSGLLRGLADSRSTGQVYSNEEVERWMCNSMLLVQMIDSIFHSCFPVTSVESASVQHSLLTFLPRCVNTPWPKFGTLLDFPSLVYLNSHISDTIRHKWRLLFASSVHGENFSLLIKHVVSQGPSVILVQDTEGYLFGGFASEEWSVRPQFAGSEESFLFSLKPHTAVFEATGYNRNFMYLNQNQETMPNGLGMGGQLDYFGLWLSQEFGKGHSKAKPQCTTFNSPQLSKSEEFQIYAVEVWGIGKSPEELRRDIEDPDEQVSILDKDPAAKAMLALVGKGPLSEGLRETDARAQSPEEHDLPPL